MYLFICLFALLMFRDCKVSTPQPEITRSTIIGQHQVLLAYYPQEYPYSFRFTSALRPATTTTKTHNQMLKGINYLHSMAYSVHIGQKLLNRQIVTYFHILFMAGVFFLLFSISENYHTKALFIFHGTTAIVDISQFLSHFSIRNK